MKFNIKELRRAKKMTQKEVADALFISQSNYHYIENNKVALTFEMAIKLTEILDCTLYDIAGIEDDLEIQGFQKVESEDIEFILFMKEKHKK